MENSEDSGNRNIIIAVIVGAISICCVCALCAGGWFAVQSASTFFAELNTQIAASPGPFLFTPAFDTPTPAPIIITTPIPTSLPGQSDTLNALGDEIIPINDLREIAMRLKGIPDIPETVGDTNNDWPIGHELEFSATNTDTNESFRLQARLIYKTENVYFFAGNDVDVDEREVTELLDDFQQNVYPTDREFFGNEPNPGIDGDPHIYILYARGLGFSIAGYQSSADGYSTLAQEDSNEKEIYYINADTVSIDDPSQRYTLAHEFQHMIHGHHDSNEDTWMNEGFSVLAQFLNGDRNIFFDFAFTNDPDLQLNTWSEGGAGDNSGPHYGAAFLYLAYFLDRFGNEATQTIVADEANGMQAVDNALAALGATDNGQPIKSVDVFADWAIANYLNDPSVGDGRYAYHNYPEMPRIQSPTAFVSDCPYQESATVHQFAADYIEIQCTGTVALNFTGSQQIKVVPTEPHSGRYFFWGNRGDKSDTTMTREFDLTGVSAATLNFWTWYAIEEDYDYAYVEVSTDGGQTFTILDSQTCTTADPSGNSFGCGWNHNSGGGDVSDWIEESVDLTPYAGQKILIRFEYITDDAVNRPGFLVDDISIPELNYSEDFESGEGGWDGAGYVLMDNFLPQQFVVQLIRRGNETTVERLPLTDGNVGSITLELTSGETVTLVVSGVTPYTTEVASYQFEVK